MELNEDFELEESATERGMKWLGRVLAIIIVLVVSAFGDVMYITLMSSKFPAGLLLVICYVGAFTSLLAVIYMLVGKSVLFTPGPQMVVAWFVFALELLLIALNIILVFHSGSDGGFLEVWDQIAPATPVVNMAGVAILFFMDETQKMKHEDVELSWDMKRANRRHFKAMAKARLKLQTKQLNFLVTELDRAVAAPESGRHSANRYRSQCTSPGAVERRSHLSPADVRASCTCTGSRANGPGGGSLPEARSAGESKRLPGSWQLATGPCQPRANVHGPGATCTGSRANGPGSCSSACCAPDSQASPPGS